MHLPSPTQSSPAGCLIGLLATLPAFLLILGIWGMSKWLRLPHEHQHINAYFWAMLTAILAGGILTTLLIWLAYRILKSTDFKDYAPKDPDHTNLKW